MVDTTREIEPLPLSDNMHEFIKTTVNTKEAIKQLWQRYPNCSIYAPVNSKDDLELTTLLVTSTSISGESLDSVMEGLPNKEPNEYGCAFPYILRIPNLCVPTMDITDCVEDL